MNSLIEKVFNEIPAERILELARSISLEIKNNPHLVQLKDKTEYVTEADIQIQKFILDYFAHSSLAGSYLIKAEEALVSEQNQNHSNFQYQLIVDPLDGTNAFCRNEESWGSMVGLCDRAGRIIYSWNLLSNGEIFSTSGTHSSLSNWTEAMASKGCLTFDVFDYGSVAVDRFKEAFKSKTSDPISEAQIQITSYPSAVWTGSKLYNGQLDGLLWLPSNLGKKSYPDYDLTVFGVLKEQGWQAALGKLGADVVMIAVAPTENELEILWETGVSMMNEETASSLIYDGELRITSAL